MSNRRPLGRRPGHYITTPRQTMSEANRRHKLQLGYWRKNTTLLALTRLAATGAGGRASYRQPAWLSPSSCNWSRAIASLQSMVCYCVEITSHFRCRLTIVAERDCRRVLREISGWVSSLLRDDDVRKARVNEATPSTVRQWAAVYSDKRTYSITACISAAQHCVCEYAERRTRSRLTKATWRSSSSSSSSLDAGAQHCISPASMSMRCHHSVFTTLDPFRGHNHKFITRRFLPSLPSLSFAFLSFPFPLSLSIQPPRSGPSNLP